MPPRSHGRAGPAPVYLLAGDQFLVEEALARVRLEAATDPLSEARFDGGVGSAELITALETPSLLGGRRLVTVHGAHELRKEHAEAIAAYLESPAQSSVLVLIAPGRTKLDAIVRKAGTVVALEPPKGRRLVGWVRTRGSEKGLRLDDRACWTLIDAVGVELRDLDVALSQLATARGPDARVGAADVRRAFPRLADQRIFVLTDAVGERRLPAAMGALRRLLEQGDEPLVLLGALVAHMRRLLRVRREADGAPATVADLLGMPGWRAERIAKQARSYKEDELIDAMAALAETDVEIKGGDLPPAAALERAVVAIVVGATRAEPVG
jgi:DNA polymerase III subunit delta